MLKTFEIFKSLFHFNEMRNAYCLSKFHSRNKGKKGLLMIFIDRFLKDFIRNAEKGSLSRLNLLDRSEEEQQRIIIESNAKIRDLEFKCKQVRYTYFIFQLYLIRLNMYVRK